MPVTRRDFLESPLVAPLAAAAVSTTPDAASLARKHALVRHIPTPNFFEGMLLGNGDIGVVAVVRPDALGLHIGKSDVWDIRVSEDHIDHLKPFAEILKMWDQAGARAKAAGKPDEIFLESRDAEMRVYMDKVRSSYAKPWPRPWPCGTVWLHWDSRMVRVVKQTLDISTGVYTLDVEHDDLRGHVTPHSVVVFADWTSQRIHVSCATALPLASIAFYAQHDAQAKMPAAELAAVDNAFECRQVLPATPPAVGANASPRSAADRLFVLRGAPQGNWQAPTVDAARRRVFVGAKAAAPWRLDVALVTTLDDAQPARRAAALVAEAAAAQPAALRAASSKGWARFWAQSAVALADQDLERLWYHNQYFLACCLRPGKVAPGLFGNWSQGSIGTAWHGDYHMNYNTQQVFWGVFSSNHVEQHLPYVELVRNLMPMAEWNARVQFGLPGAYFPHSAYPVPSKANPYPVPPWGYEICETPWTVQSLWWHYRYTMDREFLASVYPILRAATEFLIAFFKKEADGKYHVWPTVSPENWGMTVDYRLNKDCIIDIVLTEFLLDAMLEASATLDRDADQRAKWREFRDNLAPLPTVDGPHGKVWLDVAGAPAEFVYNVPVTLSPIFPGERTGLGKRAELRDVALRTTRTVRLEGGNDLVWQPLVRARLGVLDLNWFKREVAYCLLPNGVANDRTRQIGGRYRDETNPDFMMRMGVWTENLSLPAVINECMMQSWAGAIRLFPNTRNLGPARFTNLRADGAFLVTAAWDGAKVTEARVKSEKGGEVRIVAPWPKLEVRCAGAKVDARREGEVVRFLTESNRTYDLILTK